MHFFIKNPNRSAAVEFWLDLFKMSSKDQNIQNTSIRLHLTYFTSKYRHVYCVGIYLISTKDHIILNSQQSTIANTT